MDWIVVADNSTYTLRTTGQILCKQKMRVTGIKTGQMLLDFVKRNRPDLILLGSEVMEELGGAGAISALRAVTEGDEDIPLILLADRDTAEPEANIRAMGFAGVICKPFTAESLTGRVREVLALHGKPDTDEKEPAWSSLEEIAQSLEDCNASSNGMWMGRDAFGTIYRQMLHYMERYHGTAFQVLFTLEMPEDTGSARRGEIMAQFRKQLQLTLRNSDLMFESGENQMFLLLLEVEETDIGYVISRVINEWKQSEFGPITDISSEVRKAKMGSSIANSGSRDRADWIVVVDDDDSTLKTAGHFLSKQHMRVTALKSGRALLEYVRDNRPDLILLDIRMPEMDGFETLQLLKKEMSPGNEIPVIFLTSDENAQSETRGLELGAMDFIKKPFVPDVLALRVKHIIELVRLQKNLSDEVERKTQENENLSLQIVQTLAETIDAKDTYTNGHSGRVAAYSREIARRYGYSKKRQDEIFMMGLLHDVGKIGVPDAVINKPGRLTDEEYEQIKKHPVLGERILKRIREMPKLSIGARWHHERYDGTGYPDGLSGSEILEEARIIAVADAYDAMTSFRSYRDMLSQEAVKQELLQGRGTQFDPEFVDIMLDMIDEDKEFRMREK